MLITTQPYDQENDDGLCWEATTDVGLVSHATTESGAVSMIAKMLAEREKSSHD